MKTYLIALISFLIAPVLAFAALDVTLSESSVVSVGGYSLVVSGSASVDSILVDTSSFSVVLSSGASLTVTSADRKAFTVSPSSYTTSQTCSATQSLVTVGLVSGPVTTVTVTPSSSNCTLSEGGIVGGGGGGGGGGAPTPVYTVIPGTASSASSVSVGATTPGNSPDGHSSNAVSDQDCHPHFAKQGASRGGITITITKSLKLGSQNSEVKSLQQALAQDKTLYPEGLATGYYGPATRRAIIRFQKKYGIEPVGFIGPLTRKKLNEIYGTPTSASVGGTPAVSVGGTTPSATSGQAKTQQIQAIQTLINQLLEQVKALQAKKTQ